MDDKIFEKFSESARTILLNSQQMAESMSTPLSSTHVLLAIIAHKGTFANEIVREYDVNLDQIKLVMSLEPVMNKVIIQQKDDLQILLLNAIKLASDYQHITVDAEHLLLAIVSNDRLQAHGLIVRLGINPEHLQRQIRSLFDEIAEINQIVTKEEKTKKSNKTKNKGKTPALDYFTIDLTRKAARDEFDPVVGREQEQNRLIQILCRRTKNNPLLIGEPGVGKTAIVEGLAQRITGGNVPQPLLGKRLIALDLPLLIAGTMYRGQFEDRLKKVVDEIKNNGEIILFIDEIHTIIGAGSAEGSLDAANILKPALTQGWIRLIGATTHEEYRKHIKKDSAFERRLQKVVVEEPSASEALAIMQGLRVHYEKHHGVTITDEALEASVELSVRYMPDQFLPDKAIDLIDEAAAATHLAPSSQSPTLRLRQKIAKISREKDQAVTDENYDLASQLKIDIDRLTQQLARHTKNKPKKAAILINRVNIAALVAASTGIPVTDLANAERQRYSNLELILKEHIIGQDEAIAAVSKAVKRARIGLSNPNRPMGSFMFLGPTGVGKTELARILAKEIFGTEKALIKIDMSDFMERHNTSRLVGAPAGYVGYEDGGKLTEAVRRQPYSVVLFDEIEKAHPEVFNMLLQLMDEGQLVDAKGQATNFRNAIIILTSNLGMAELNRQAAIGFEARSNSDYERATKQFESVKASIAKALKDQFRPEFLNRLDGTIIFRPLNKISLETITSKMINEVITRVAKLGHTLTVKQNVIEFLAATGFDPSYGARPLRRAIEEHLEAPIAEYLLKRTLRQPTVLLADMNAQTIRVKALRKKAAKSADKHHVTPTANS